MNHDDHGKKHGRYHGMIMTMFRHDHGNPSSQEKQLLQKSFKILEINKTFSKFL